MSNRRRGLVVLVLVLSLAFAGTIGAYALLDLAKSQKRQEGVWRRRARARYLAEAGTVLARERLRSNPAYCGGTELIDTNGDRVGDTPVAITLSSCGADNRHVIRVTAVY